LTISLIASPSIQNKEIFKELVQSLESVAPENADTLVIFGGDGFMLRSLQKYQHLKKPFYGINLGTIGFLMNNFEEGPLGADILISRIKQAQKTTLHPLEMTALNSQGEYTTRHAINEVSLLRQTFNAAKIKISIDGIVRLDTLVCDGVLLATPAGSTAYNLSAHGPILPLNANLLALTPISPFRPRRWRGAVLPNKAIVTFDVLDPIERSVSATADNFEVRDIVRVDIRQDLSLSYVLLFDPGHNLEDRVLKEQFII